MDVLLLERDEALPGLVTVVLNRPASLNAINTEMHEELQEVCTRLRVDHEARVVILTGAGRAFSAGADVKAAAPPPVANALEARVRAEIGSRTSEALEALPQVTIGAVNGLAIGGAVVFLSCLDIRLAAESAWFSIPEVDLDIPLTWSALPRLMRELGPALTKELVMTCDRFGSADALRFRFVSHVYPDSELMPSARALAAKLLSKEPLALARTKAATNALAQLMVPAQPTYSDPDLLMTSRRRPPAEREADGR